MLEIDNARSWKVSLKANIERKNKVPKKKGKSIRGTENASAEALKHESLGVLKN